MLADENDAAMEKGALERSSIQEQGTFEGFRLLRHATRRMCVMLARLTTVFTFWPCANCFVGSCWSSLRERSSPDAAQRGVASLFQAEVGKKSDLDFKDSLRAVLEYQTRRLS